MGEGRGKLFCPKVGCSGNRPEMPFKSATWDSQDCVTRVKKKDLATWLLGMTTTGYLSKYPWGQGGKGSHVRRIVCKSRRWHTLGGFPQQLQTSGRGLDCPMIHLEGPDQTDTLLLKIPWFLFFKNLFFFFIFFFTCSLFNDFYFFYYSWFTVFCQISTVQQSDPVTQTCIHSFFLMLPCSIISDQT